MNNNTKHTKIICTIGPASQHKTVLTQMIQGGMNVARLNFSHGDYTDHAKLIRNIHQAAKASKRTVAILQDLQGPRIRLGILSSKTPEILLKKKQKVVLLPQHEYDAGETPRGAVALPVQYRKLFRFVKKSHHIYIKDGMIDLRVDRVDDDHIYCTVVQGGTVSSHKGINVPQANLAVPVITVKDKEDIRFGVRQKVDYMALSFVKNAQNIRQLRTLLPKRSGIKIIAKIERAEAVENFDEILAEVDGIMIARGDLGVELGTAKVPLLQKTMIMKCLHASKPVIVATQMLESMTENPRPTRAEAADVANAIIDHTDAIMLSGETANGQYPVHAVRTMTSIAHEVEPTAFDDLSTEQVLEGDTDSPIDFSHLIAAMQTPLKVKAIIIWSRNGELAPVIAKARPQHARIIICSDNEQVLRQQSLIWGVHAMHMPKPKNRADFTRLVKNTVRKEHALRRGALALLIYDNTNEIEKL